MIKICEKCKKEFNANKSKQKFCSKKCYHQYLINRPIYKKRKYKFIETPLHDTRIYKIWQGIKTRCYSTSDKKHYKNYGSRGITVCDEWKNDFLKFYNWAISSGYTDELTIERINVNGNYEPSNCTWMEIKKQARNRTTTLWVNYKNKERCLSEVAEIENVKISSLYQAFKRYNDINEAVRVAKLNKHGLMITNKTGYVGVYPDGKKWYVKYKHNYYGVYNTIEEAIEVRKKVEEKDRADKNCS